MGKNYVENLRDEVSEKPMLGLAIAMFPGGIEASEAAGQAQLVQSDVLPADCRDKAIFEAWGVKFGEPVKGDPLFVNVELPAGWSKRRTEHSMWSDLVDNKGHKRGGIFYKAAFYDRGAHLSSSNRLFVSRTYDEGDTQYGIVKTSDEVEIYRTEGVQIEGWDKAPDREQLAKRDAWYKKRCALDDAILADATQWAEKHYPNYKDVNAYWELDMENGEKP